MHAESQPSRWRRWRAPRKAPRRDRNASATPDGLTLGRRLSGERALPARGGGLILPFEALRRHVLVLGASGTGKTETSLRIAHQVAAATEAPVFYLDAKGDRATAERFCGLMRDAGRATRVFPHEPFDAWRGDWRAIANRLLDAIEFPVEGPAAYYRDIAKNALVLACHHPGGPPRSSAELLGRLDYDHLLDAHGPTGAVLALPRDQVANVRLRYEAFFGQMGTALDGDWSFEDAEAGYLLLDSLALGEDAIGAACLVFSDFAHYFTKRKPEGQLAVLVVDEFSAIASASDVAIKVEQARSFGAGLVLAPQTVSGMGRPSQRDRILGSVETVIAHAVNEPERIAELAGSRRAVDLSHRVGESGRDPEGVVRYRERPKVEPDRVRDLPAGTAWVIRRGRAAKLAVHRAPRTEPLELPEPAPIDRPIDDPTQRPAPKELSYLDEEDSDA